jgi:hypothetical protein
LRAYRRGSELSVSRPIRLGCEGNHGVPPEPPSFSCGISSFLRLQGSLFNAVLHSEGASATVTFPWPRYGCGIFTIRPFHYLDASLLPNSHLDEIDAPHRITFDFVLPNSNYVPTIPPELPEVAQITPPISFDLGLPMKISNTNTIQFGPAANDWLSAVAFGVFDAQTNGNLLYWNTLPAAKTIQQGDFGQFAPGSLVVEED